MNELDKQYPNFAKLTAYLNSKRNPRQVLNGILLAIEPTGNHIADETKKTKIGVG